jgi:hypothetical protein
MAQKSSKRKNLPQQLDPWVLRYVNRLKKSLKLTDWNIIVLAEPCASDSLGEIDVVFGQQYAKMQLNKNFKKQKPEELRSTIIHELLHCHFAPITEAAQEILDPIKEDPGGTKIIRSTLNGLEYQQERVIDNIAEAIAPHFPLPDIPKGRKIRVKRKKLQRRVSKKR